MSLIDSFLIISLVISLAAIDSVRAQNCSSTIEFTCLDGTCISIDRRCDGSFECPNREDEINCTETKNCPEGLSLCLDGSCASNCAVTTDFETTFRPTTATSEPTSTSTPIAFTTQDATTNEASTWPRTIQQQNNDQTTGGPAHVTGTSPLPTPKTLIPEEKNKNLYLLILLLIPVIVIAGIILWCCRQNIKYWLEKGHQDQNEKALQELT